MFGKVINLTVRVKRRLKNFSLLYFFLSNRQKVYHNVGQRNEMAYKDFLRNICILRVFEIPYMIMPDKHM